MAATQSKGHKKRNSPLQKAHYQAYRLINKRRSNLIARLKCRIRRNKAEIKRKAARTPPRVIKVDRGAVNRLKELST